MGSRFLANLLRGTYAEGAKSRGLKIALVFAIAFIVSFLIAREVFFRPLVFGDYPYVTLQSGPVIGEYIFQGWNRAAYGENYPMPLAYVFLYFFSQLAAFFGSPSFFNFLMNLSFPLSFVAFYFFSEKFCKNFWLRIFGSAMYIINPAVLAYYNTGGFIWTFVFLPFALSFFIDFLEKHTFRNLAKAAVFTGLTMWAFPTLTIVLVLVLGSIALTYFIYTRPKKAFLRAALPGLLVFVLAILLMNVSFYYAEYQYAMSPSFGFQSEDILNDFKYAYQAQPDYQPEILILNFLRLSGNVASPQASLALGYINPTLTNVLGFVIPIVAFASVFWLRKRQENTRATAAMVVSVAFISVLMLLIEAALNIKELNGIIVGNSVLWTLRNPLKLQLMLAACLIPLFIFSLEKIANSANSLIRQKSLRKRVLAGLAFVLVFLAVSQIYVYNAFAFNGYAGLDKTYTAVGISILPDETLKSIVNDSGSAELYDEGTFRGIILPFDHNAELHVEFTNPFLYAQKLGLTTPMSEQLTDAINRGTNLNAVFSLFSTKYVYNNTNWNFTYFSIIQPQDFAKLSEGLEAGNLSELNGYTKFTVDTPLPRLYLSNCPIVLSDIHSLGMLNSSFGDYRPVFFQMNSSSTDPNSYSYVFNLPTQGTYDIYVTCDGNGTEVPAYYQLDNGQKTDIILSSNAAELNHITKATLSPGNHTLSLGIPNWLEIKEPFSETKVIYDDPFDLAYGYNNYDVNLQFKLDSLANWGGMEVKLNWNESAFSYIRLIFTNSSVEIAKAKGGAYQPNLHVEPDVKLREGSWNDLWVEKRDNTLTVHLNEEQPFTFNDVGLIGTGQIALGPVDQSITSFSNVTITEKTMISGVGLLPTETQNYTTFEILENNPDKYRIEFNQTSSNSPIIVLGENFDMGWGAIIDGQPLSSHFEANLYANGWLTNTTAGTHEVEIYYKYNGTYQSLVSIDIAIMVALAIVSYLPARLTKMVHIQWRIRRNKQNN